MKSEGRHFLPVFTFEKVIDSRILTIMSDTGTCSYCTICVTNNGDIANVDKDFDISVSSEGTVDLTDSDSLSESDNFQKFNFKNTYIFFPILKILK